MAFLLKVFLRQSNLLTDRATYFAGNIFLPAAHKKSCLKAALIGSYIYPLRYFNNTGIKTAGHVLPVFGYKANPGVYILPVKGAKVQACEKSLHSHSIKIKRTGNIVLHTYFVSSELQQKL